MVTIKEKIAVIEYTVKKLETIDQHDLVIVGNKRLEELQKQLNE